MKTRYKELKSAFKKRTKKVFSVTPEEKKYKGKLKKVPSKLGGYGKNIDFKRAITMRKKRESEELEKLKRKIKMQEKLRRYRKSLRKQVTKKKKKKPFYGSYDSSGYLSFGG